MFTGLEAIHLGVFFTKNGSFLPKKRFTLGASPIKSGLKGESPLLFLGGCCEKQPFLAFAENAAGLTG